MSRRSFLSLVLGAYILALLFIPITAGASSVDWFSTLTSGNTPPPTSEIISSGTCGDGVQWTLDREGLLRIWGNNAIADPTWDKSSVKSVEIQQGVTSIGNGVFEGCDYLTRVSIPDSVTSIEDNAFLCCYRLKNVTIPDSVTSIGSFAFYYCYSLDAITLPPNLTVIKDRTFCYCWNIKSITIPAGVISIGEGAFMDCAFTSLSLPINLRKIDSYAFQSSDLRLVEIPESVTSFGIELFGNSKPTVYCYSSSDADYWATSQGLSVIYLDQTDFSNIRKLTIENEFLLGIDDSYLIKHSVFPSLDNPTVFWSSNDSQIASVSNGIVTAIRPGSCTITATCDNVSASVNITVYKAPTDFTLSCEEEWVLARDDYEISILNMQPADAEPYLKWISSDEEYAIVSSTGLVTTFKPGNVTITATSENGISRSSLLHLCYPVTAISFEELQEIVVPNKDVQLIANVTMRTQSCVNHLVTFTSSNEEIATVDELTGMLHPVAEGMVTVTATARSGKTASLDIFVDHDWGEPEYVWNGGNLTVTATRVCAFDGEHVETETVSTTAAIQSPTATKEGNAHYTVTFANEAFADQEKNVFIPALNAMTVLNLPVSLTTIETEAFDNVAAEAIILPDTVTAIEPKAFTNCMNLQYIRIPASMTIPDDAFEGSQNVVVDQ